MTKFVVGFLFSPDRSKVVLIRKNRGPGNMAGHLNGVGGKVEEVDGGRLELTMTREFLEETGVYIDPDFWKCFHAEQFGEHHVTFFESHLPAYSKVATMTDEAVGVYDKDAVLSDPSLKVFYNIPDLVRLALKPPSYRPPKLSPVMAYLDIDTDFKLKNLMR